MRSLVGLLPLCATTVIVPDVLDAVTRELGRRIRGYLERNRELLANIADPLVPGRQRPPHAVARQRGQAAAHPRRACSTRSEFLGPHGIRSLSRWHLDHPYAFDVARPDVRGAVRAGGVDTGMFGGNSNWRGPVWFPVNLLILRALLQHYRYYGDDFTIECPTGSGTQMTLFEVAKELVATG